MITKALGNKLSGSERKRLVQYSAQCVNAFAKTPSSSQHSLCNITFLKGCYYKDFEFELQTNYHCHKLLGFERKRLVQHSAQCVNAFAKTPILLLPALSPLPECLNCCQNYATENGVKKRP